MNRKALVVLALWLLAIPAIAAAADAPAWLSADEFNLEPYSGEVVLVDFWASWCKPCKESMPWLSALQEKYGDQGLRIVAVNIDKKRESALEMSKMLHGDVTLVHDPAGKLAEKYELQGMPSSYLYDRSGELVNSHVGFLAADCEAKEAELEALLNEGIAEDDNDTK